MNELGIGPQGLGGRSTSFRVHVEVAATHITHESGRREHPVPLGAPRQRDDHAGRIISLRPLHVIASAAASEIDAHFVESLLA